MCHDSSNNQEWGLANDLLPDHLGRTIHHRGAATGGILLGEIARRLGRHRSTISREVRRNSSRSDGCYRPSKAIEKTNGRRARSRRNQYFTKADFALVEKKLKADWSPEQISGHLRLHGELSISHETIYIHVWRDKEAGGHLYRHLRCSPKLRRKRHNGIVKLTLSERTYRVELTSFALIGRHRLPPARR